ncbi:MAG TPA: hypothetical protein VMK05_10625 [Burkholderiales bacterium]|nr:hypothetical protein [Burkholderiales bacterium]
MNNPYSPPGTEVADGPPRPPRGSRLKAVVIGCLVDTIGTTLFVIASSFAISVALALGGMPTESIARTLADSPAYQLFSFVAGMSFTVLGGFVAARIANYLEYRTALWVGFIGLVLGELMFSTSPDPAAPLWTRIMGDLLIMPAALFGANLKVKRYGKGH